LLARDDISQHVVSVFLELLASNEFRACRSHVAFAISRKLRRHAFRWAIREARLAVARVMEETPIEEMDDREPLDAQVILQDFLDNCQTAGWLLDEERSLLIQLKVQGVSCRELASRNGHSAVAIQHKIQRVLDKLRRVAAKNPPRQLEMFPPGTKKKIFL
jgi:DNA-directed RNA polymerase specialized sigma24 family protein